jgi:hypothetical protein
MLHSSTNVKPRTIGHGTGGITDKILHGSDLRHTGSSRPTAPPTLQDIVFRSLIQGRIRISHVDGSETSGVLVWYSDGNFGIRRAEKEPLIVLPCNRVARVIPIGVSRDSVPFIEESIRTGLIAQEERSSKQQIVKRRLKEQDKRNSIARQYQRNQTGGADT